MSLLAIGAALAAVLTGLARNWDFWSVVRRMAVGYFAAYMLGAALVALGRLALLADDRKAPETTRKQGEARRTSGTDAAI